MKNNKITIGINLRNWFEIDRIVRELGIALSEFKKNDDINFLLLPFSPDDTKYCEKLYQHTGKNTFMVTTNPENIFMAINQCDICVGMRFHFTAIANLLNKPVLNITYDAKCKNALRGNERVNFISAKHIRAFKISKNIKKMLGDIK